MLAILQFIFSSFWVFAGTYLLIAAAGEAAACGIRAWRERN